jgi:hypothetical protein
MRRVAQELAHRLFAALLFGHVLEQEDRRVVLVRGDSGDTQRATVVELDVRCRQRLRQRDETLGQRVELVSAERLADLDRLAPEDADGAIVREGDAAVAPDADDCMRKTEEETAEVRRDQNVRTSPSAARSMPESSGSSSGR